MVADGARRPPAMVGRDDVLRVCESAVDRARAGTGGLLLVAGEPGIGKTTVLLAAADAARTRKCTVVCAACPEDDAVPAFWPLVRLLTGIARPAATAAAEELAGRGPGGVEEHRFVLFDRAADAVRQAATPENPLVLILDDLHWADPSSVRLLGFLVKQLRSSPVLLLGSYRDTDVGSGHPLLELLAEPATSGETLTLLGLAVEDVATLVARAGGAGTESAALRIREHTGGNPFFVLHVARLLDAEGHFTRPGAALPLPLGVQAVLERRLARLTQACSALLGVAAVIGSPFDVSLLTEICGSDAASVTDLLAESTAARLTHPVEPGVVYEFAHALVRATVTAQLPAERRAALHGAVADAIRRRSGTDETSLPAIALHELHAPGDRPATRGVDAAEQAGRSAVAARAFEQAAEHFARAISACRDSERLADLHLRLGDAHLRSGDWDAGAAAFSRAADLARALARPDLFAAAALGIGADTGGFEVRLWDRRQLARLEEALAFLGNTGPELRARLLARLSVAATNVHSAAERTAWSDEAVDVARRTGNGRVLAYALSAWCDARSGPAHVDERWSAAEEMLAAAEASGDREAALTARRFRVVASLERGDPAVHEEIDRFAAVADALGQPLYRWYVPLFRGMQALLRGDLEAADRLCAEAAGLGQDAGSDNARMLSATQAAAIAVERGEFLGLVGIFEAALQEQPWMRELPIAIAMAPLIDVGRGREAEARAKLHALAAERFARIPVDSEWLSTLSGIAMAVLRLGEPVSASAMYEVLRPHAGQMIVDGIAASCLDPVDYLLGRCALVNGRAEVAAAHLEAAAEQARRLGAPLLEAHAHHALGSALARSDPRRGRSLRAGAESVLRAAGAAPVLVTGAGVAAVPEAARRTGVFHQDGAMWTLTFEDRTVRLPDSKGLRDLRHLVGRPGTPVPATALQHGGDPVPAAAVSHGFDVLDDRARADYRARLEDLEEEIADAEVMADTARATRARDERAFLVAELTAAVGLGGRSRRMGDDADRARKAVTMRVRNAVARIAREHPALARHLDLTVRTGTVCVYEPEEPVVWSV